MLQPLCAHYLEDSESWTKKAVLDPMLLYEICLARISLLYEAQDLSLNNITHSFSYLYIFYFRYFNFVNKKNKDFSQPG